MSYNGNFNSPDREKKLDALKEAAAFIREYAGLYESSPPMEIRGHPGIPEAGGIWGHHPGRYVQ